MVESCYKKDKHILNPIIDWKEKDVWQFIKQKNIPYCSLYDEGFKRLGCVFCPMQSRKQRLMECQRWPGYEKSFRIAFRKLHENRKEIVKRWQNGDEMFDWWISGIGAGNKNQTKMDFAQ